MNLKFLPPIFLVVAAIIYYFREPAADHKQPLETVINKATSRAEAHPAILEYIKKSTPLSLAPRVVSGNTAGSGFLPTHLENGERFEQIQQQMQAMSECLDFPVQELTGRESFNLEALHGLMGGHLGEIRALETEWQALDVQLPNGEKRRLTIEMDSSSQTQKARYFSYKTEGFEEVPLTEAQKNLSPEDLVTQVESEGEVKGRFQSQGIRYQSKATLRATERDGSLYSFVLVRQGRVFTCVDLDQENLNCRCEE